MTDFIDRALLKEQDRRIYQQESLIRDIVEEICRLMEDQGVTRAELARRIGVKPSTISLWLSGQRKLYLRSITDMLWALGYEWNV